MNLTADVYELLAPTAVLTDESAWRPWVSSALEKVVPQGADWTTMRLVSVDPELLHLTEVDTGSQGIYQAVAVEIEVH